jgi:uncharacterized membrane protein
MAQLKRIVSGAATVGVIAACELGTHYAASTPGTQGFGLAVVLAPLLVLSFAAAARSPQRAWLLPAWIGGCVALWFARAPLVRHFEWGAYLEHLGVTLIMAFAFGRTLAAGRRPLCSQFAALVHGKLTPAIARYTRRITVAWTAFFVSIAALSTLLFVAAPVVVWSTFANYMTLPLVAVMFVAEHAWRRVALPDVQPSSMAATARAYRHTMHGRAERAQ